ncbi:MAG: glycoside hydrolase family 3 C-terminal domain-containing protein [Clostridiales Family XIII bacterium]|nr:glycoside hydrolase family 3 C-terminal domain-containing protein [Clostridiales Family XIII bacterium]
MERKPKWMSKLLAVFLTAILVISVFPVSGLADDPAPTLAAPTYQLDGTRTQLRLMHNNAFSNAARMADDYEGADAVRVYYTEDGTEPTSASTRISIVPGSVRVYIFDPVPGVTYRAVIYSGSAKSFVGDYTMTPNPPTWQLTNGVPMTSNGLYDADDLAGGIVLAAGEGQEIYYRTALADYDVSTGIIGATDIDAATVANIENGTKYEEPISVAGVSETKAIVIKAIAKTGSLVSGLASFYARSGDPIKLEADADGNLTMDLDAFVEQLSIDERIALTSGVGGDPTMLLNGINNPRESNNDGIPNRGGPAGGTIAIPRFNIPALVLADGPAGVRMWKNATVWMAPAGLGSTWNAEIPKLIGEATSNEAKHYAVDIVLGPGLNTQRYPLAGRNFEYYSEDPYISGYSTVAYVAAIQAGGVGTSLKHYAANDYETGRGGGSSNVTERALREIYLRPFEMAASVQPWTYMSGYNAINGVADHVNKWLHTTVLRDEWGFEGFVMSDWGTNNNPGGTFEAQMDMGQSSRTLTTVRSWVTAANITDAERAYRVGLIDRSVKNILRVTVKTSAFRGEYGVLQPDGTYADGVKLDGTPTVGLRQEDIGLRSSGFGGSDVQKASAVVNKQAADEAIVLLKNNDALLPLSSGTKVALITSRLAWAEQFDPRWYGDSASIGDVVIQGTGSAQVRFNNNTAPYSDSLRDALATRDLQVVDWKIDAGAYGGNDAAFKAAYQLDIESNPNESKYRYGVEQTKAKADEAAAWAVASATNAASGAANAAAAAAAAAATADVGIFVLTRVSGEGADLSQTTFNLSALERTVFNAYASAFHAAGKKLIVLLNVGGTVNTTEFRADADAILDIWNPGTEGTRAIADILVGNVNPSGKLAQSFPRTYTDSPSIAMAKPGHSNTVNGSNAYYDEGVYVGYRYYETNPETYESMVAYPFGYGLSYTKFQFSALSLDKKIFDKSNPDDTVTANVTVTNVGDVAGKEVVQLYLGADTWREEGRPKNELKAYAKTGLLEPGDSETVALTLKLRDLQYFDDGNPDAFVPTAPQYITKYGIGAGWTVADDTSFKVMVRTNAENAAKPNVAFSGLSAFFTYGDEDSLATEVKLSPARANVKVKGTLQLKVDSDAKDGNWEFASSNSAIAKVDPKTGVVTGVKAGTAMVTVTLADGSNLKSTVVVNVAY